jgi:hypothetical protein
VGLFLGNLLINTGQRATANLTQELILRRLTPKAKNQTKTTADRGDVSKTIGSPGPYQSVRGNVYPEGAVKPGS